MAAMEDLRESRRRLTKAALIAEVEALERRLDAEEGQRQPGSNPDFESEVDARILFRSLVDHSPFGVVVKDRQGRYVSANRTWLSWLGLEEGNVLGKTPREVFPEALAAKIAAEDEMVLRTGDSSVIEREFDLWKIPHTLSVTRFPVRDQRGNIVAVGVISNDITEQKRMESALRESESRLQAFVDHSPSEIVAKDLKGRYIISASRWLTQVGRTRADVIGKTSREIFPRDYAIEVERRDRQVIETGETVEAENTFVTAQGKRIFTLTKFPIRDASGKITGIGAISTDITKYKQAEAALRQSEERFRDFALSAADGFWETGPDLRLTFVSERFLASLPLYQRDILGKTWDELASWDPDDTGRRRHLDRLRLMQSFRDLRFRLPMPDRTLRHVRVSGKPFFTEAGTFRGYRGTLSDVTTLVEAERKVASAEARLVDAIEHVPAGIALYDAEDRLVLCNGEYRKREPGLEPRVGDSFEKNMRRVIAAGGFHASMGEREQWLAKRLSYHRGAPSHHEQRLPDGRWLSVREHRTREGGVLILGTDTTEQKRAAQALAETEARFRAFVEHSPNRIHIKDRRLRYLVFDKRTARRLGISDGEAIGKTPREIFPKSRAEIYIKLGRAVLRSKKTVEEEITIVHNGKPLTLLLHTFPIFDERGEVTSIGSISADITERKRSEAALRESEAKFRDLVEGSVQGVLIARGPKALFVNQSLADIFGYSRDEILRLRNVGHLAAPEERKRIQGYAKNRVRGRSAPVRYEFQGLRKDGSRIWLENVVRIVSWEGKPAIQATLVDVTERRRAAEQYRARLASMAHARRLGMIGELTTSLAHELNQPLAALITYLHGSLRFAEATNRTTRPIAQALKKATEQAKLMDAIIRRLREFIRRRAPVLRVVDVNAAIGDALGLVQDESRRLGVTLRTRLAQRLPRVRGDNIQIEQVVLNLVRNGMEAVRDKGGPMRRVTVRSFPEAGAGVAIEVADTGPGIPKGTLPRLFEPFFSTKDGGLGMGLAISRWIVEDHGGRISVAAGRRSGAIFRVVLPAAR
jgi:PAS domain S-box-containing protein